MASLYIGNKPSSDVIVTLYIDGVKIKTIRNIVRGSFWESRDQRHERRHGEALGGRPPFAGGAPR